ncbi:hypothetical protein OLZ32_10085 [Rhizobium sp. 1AS11]|uniref:hypothetical protein n=1 Tax=Rhizobium acaciae TaxID=2989736 RepID=UPI0022216B81|nr:hypothetical protein [Rhizobium acaciae]MCW1408643.1 hypothetical protein [Rhizobium acaciae]MCW1740757.1 hypothetical protein [Rhizobium acaciae]
MKSALFTQISKKRRTAGEHILPWKAYLRLTCGCIISGHHTVHLPETLPDSVLITIRGGKVFLTAIFKLYGTAGAYCRR